MTCLVFAVAMWLAPRLHLPNWFRWRELTKAQIAIGAAAGSYSHVVIDGLVHPEVAPFWPLTDNNPLYGVVLPNTVRWLCVGAGVVGIVLIGVRASFRSHG